MRSRLLLLIGVATVPATVSVTTAAALQPSSFAPSSVSVAPIRRAGAPDSSRINAILSRADAATFSGRANEARRLYRDLIDQQQQADQYAHEALWRLANHYLFLNDERNAAAALDELATQSNHYGDPSTEISASFEAAVLWQHAKRNDLVVDRLKRVHSLMQSPVIGDDQKRAIAERMQEK